MNLFDGMGMFNPKKPLDLALMVVGIIAAAFLVALVILLACIASVLPSPPDK